MLPYAPELFPPNVSSGVCGFSPDGRIIYFVQEDTVVKKLFLYQATKAGKVWGHVNLLPFSGKHNDSGGRLSVDGKTFYFTSDRPGGSATENDNWNIWATTLKSNGWSEPQPLEINNKGMECCPVPLTKGGFLFSGDRDKATAWWISRWNAKEKTETFVDGLNEQKAWQCPSYPSFSCY